MKNKPLVSVICLTYNHEKYIRKSLEGILMQVTNFDYELIIGNDCSTDNSDKMIKGYLKNHSKEDLVKYFWHDNNLGLNKNFIFTYEKCAGEYIAFCEGDDYWTDPYKLQKQVDYMTEKKEYSMCFTDSTIVDGNGNQKQSSRIGDNNKRDITQADILNGFVPPMNTVLYRNNYLQKIISDYPDIINGDYYLSVLMANYGKIGFLNSTTAAYRIHQSSSWSQLSEELRQIAYTKTLLSLKGKVQKSLEQFLENLINSHLFKLKELNRIDEFLDNHFWTPQTAMLRGIRDAVMQIDGNPKNALSIDNNPTLEKILLRKWPGLEIQKASYPEYDAQNLQQFEDETFDIVFSHQVLEHIPKPWIASVEMNRVLKKGGIGVHTTCAYNPRHGYPAFKDYYRFLPDGLAELFDGVNIWVKDGWGSKQAIIYNLTIDDGNGQLGGRRFVEALAKHNDIDYPWHTWIIFQKK